MAHLAGLMLDACTDLLQGVSGYPSAVELSQILTLQLCSSLYTQPEPVMDSTDGSF